MKLTEYDKEINSALTEGYRKVSEDRLGFKTRRLIPNVSIAISGGELTPREAEFLKGVLERTIYLIFKFRDASN